MKRAAVAVVLLALFAGGYALGQSQGWSADQDGSQFKLYDVQSVNVNGGLSNIDSCLVSPDSILFTPVLSSADVTITRTAQNGTGAMKIINGNQVGFLDLSASQNHLLMTAQGIDNGGETFYGATYFGVRSDTTASYPGDRDYQQVYFSPRSIYEVSGSVVTPPLNGTTLLSPYYFRGETIGLDGTAGNNTRPDGISLGFFWDQPSIVAIHGFTANSYQTGEIFGPPCSGATCYGLRIYGGSSDNSERVAGTYVADGLGGSGTRCVQVDNSGVMSIAASACGSGAGTVTAVSATNPLFITGGASPTPNVVGHGLIVSGDTVTSGQNLGAISTSMLACSTAAGVCTVDGVTVAGGLDFNTGTATETLGSFTCGANTFVSSSSTSGLACTPLGSGDVPCGALPALAGDVTSTAGSCGNHVVEIHESGGLGIPIGACTTDGQAFVKVAGSMTCRLPAGDLSNDYTAPSVIGMHDGASTDFTTSGTWTTGLPLVATAGNHITTVDILPDFTKLNIVDYMNGVSATALFGSGGGGGWLMPGTSASLSTTFHVEAYTSFAAKSCRLTANVLANSLSGGADVSISITRNGSITSPVTSVFITAGSTGTFDSGLITPTTAAGDTWGTFASQGTMLATGSLTAVVTVYVY